MDGKVRVRPRRRRGSPPAPAGAAISEPPYVRRHRQGEADVRAEIHAVKDVVVKVPDELIAESGLDMKYHVALILGRTT